MLYHNQIIIKGSPAYQEMKRAKRLIVDPSTPYEAEVKYAEPAVAEVQKGMAHHAREYFYEMNRNPKLDPVTWNQQLKDRFLELCEKAAFTLDT